MRNDTIQRRTIVIQEAVEVATVMVPNSVQSSYAPLRKSSWRETAYVVSDHLDIVVIVDALNVYG